MSAKKFDEKLLKLLCCPKCKGNLKLIKESLKCIICGKIYEIKQGIPILLLENQ